VDTVRDWLSAQLRRGAPAPARLAPYAEAWSRLDAAARDVLTLNLDRRALVFAVFGWLAEAARG
ncbi:DNA polymerase III subunit delta', partial [Rhodoplanes elegans]